ncbi:MAG: hypothetical protein IPN47_23985 [Gemmatimonadetes bacterium]|nr:hypothetical protein [Gemmatimonadota bacterium]
MGDETPPCLKSIDGGRTFAVVNAMHGDNHGFWINPTNSNYLANANDGGGSISLDGGKSWSTQDNQPTAQFYPRDGRRRFSVQASTRDSRITRR